MMSRNTRNRIATTYLVASRLWLDLSRQDNDEPENLLDKVEHIGGRALRWTEAAIEKSDVRSYRLLQDMISLTHRHPKRGWTGLAGLFWNTDYSAIKSPRHLVEQAAAWAPAQPSLIQSHEIIRQLSEYSEGVKL